MMPVSPAPEAAPLLQSVWKDRRGSGIAATWSSQLHRTANPSPIAEDVAPAGRSIAAVEYLPAGAQSIE
jgi:hypothetical protein